MSKNTLFKKIRQGVGTSILVGLLTMMPVKKSDALPTAGTSGDIDYILAWQNSGMGFDFEYTGGPIASQDEYDNVLISGLNQNGANGICSMIQNYFCNAGVNPNNPNDYTVEITSAGDSLNPWTPNASGTYYWQNTQNIETDPLTGWISVKLTSYSGRTNEFLAQGHSNLTNGLYGPVPPTPIVPEPVSTTLFVTGGALLGANKLRKSRKKK